MPSPFARRLQYQLALVTVMTPLIGVLAAIVLTWGHGVGPVEIGIMLVMHVLGVLGVEVGFHRHFSHRAFKAHPSVRAFLAICGSMAAQGPVLFWVATHRRHHAHSDSPGDPHTPHLQGEGVLGFLRGLWHAHIGWLFVDDLTDLRTYAPDLLHERLIFRMNDLYPAWLLLGLAVPAALGGLLTQSWTGCLLGLIWGGLVRTFLGHHVTWSVNSLCHVFGSRPFETNDRSTNNAWLLPTSLGGSWHNNHHAFPTAAKNSLRWWQLDPCGWFVSALAWVGLAWEVRMPTSEMQSEFNRRQLTYRAKTDEKLATTR
jgi:stearoyl-CoA desaturase (Delta-9 desaturase)